MHFKPLILSLIQNSPPKGGKERRLPDAPTPYRKVNTGVTVETNCDDKEPGPSTSAFEVTYNDLDL